MPLEVHNKLRKKNCCEKDIIILEDVLIILLCGFMGCGKSFLMDFLHKNSGGKGVFSDLDNVVLDKFGSDESSLSDLIEEKGWDFFREKEFLCLKEFLDKAKKNKGFCVLSLGGGSLNEESLKLINSTDKSVLIWLETSFEKCFERISRDGVGRRPLLKKGKGFIHKLYLERKSLYEKSHITISTDDLEKIKDLDGLIDLVHERKRRVM